MLVSLIILLLAICVKPGLRLARALCNYRSHGAGNRPTTVYLAEISKHALGPTADAVHQRWDKCPA